MKRSLIAALIAVPLVMMAQGYTLVITHSNGTTTEIPTEDITNMEFRGDNVTPPDPVEKPKLDTPYVMETALGDGSYILAWSSVSNASGYAYQINEGEIKTVTGTQVTISGLTYGKNIARVWAKAAPGSQYADSDPREVTLAVKLAVNVTVLTTDKTSISASVSLNADGECMAGIVPATVSATTDQVNYVKTNSAAQKVTFTATAGGVQPLNFTGLTANTPYNVVVFLTAEPENASATMVTTSTDLTPGSKSSIFPPGVTATSGWVDVDKVGELSKYGWSGVDNEMCWACAISGMIQWWLNDYKTKTGRDYPVIKAIPAQSKCYSTPIMDIYNDNYSHGAGLMFAPTKWFFTQYCGMTEDEAQKLFVVNKQSSDGYTIPEYEFNRLFDIKGKTTAEATKIFSERIINALRQGPVALSLVSAAGGSVHGVSCWGADFEVLSDGSYKVTKLHVSENDPLPGNVKNGLNPATITYDGDFVKLEMSTTNGTKNLNLFFGLRGYQGK